MRYCYYVIVEAFDFKRDTAGKAGVEFTTSKPITEMEDIDKVIAEMQNKHKDKGYEFLVLSWQLLRTEEKSR
jgi:hypothetical protein